MIEEVKQAYNRLSTHYEFEVDTKPYNAYLERPAMIEQLPSLKGKKVLDAGCAAGWYSAYIAGEGAEVTAVDLSEAMIKATIRRTKNFNVKAFAHDLTSPLPFENESFDLIVSSLTLHYIKDWSKVFDEFARVLKPEGSLLFSTHHPFMDYINFPDNNYYEKQKLYDEWDVNGEKVPMSFYRRPLGEIIETVTDRFRLIQLIEPTPTEDFKRVHPKGYEKVAVKPNFLVIKSKKPGTL
ncbi:Methyltransferase domain-containing protein [Halobacillus dabanensis]|uniref:Methyltransferase domain-containing protein n=1 Tax=Halobacillus dabanensis TaxID=240302 RepID=A0A1I3STA9_HALDA|nr:class I SAM-dependent methyltransferase [Halobacillus dabanensis]SFJ61623.1 Methyltransferase domain-containing protein [Halobacillus dabanensis]